MAPTLSITTVYQTRRNILPVCGERIKLQRLLFDCLAADRGHWLLNAMGLNR
jgi:hypothetical protein